MDYLKYRIPAKISEQDIFVNKSINVFKKFMALSVLWEAACSVSYAW